MDQINLYVNSHILMWMAGLVVAHNFLNNLAANIPSLKGNTWFQVLAGGINAVIETSQGKKTSDLPSAGTVTAPPTEDASPN